jgi:hypothetical protein
MPTPRRPSTTYAPNARVPMSLRVSPRLKGRIEQAADGSGRSLFGETENRLEQSFAIEDAYGGPRTAAVLRALADEKRAFYGDDDSWLDDREACLAVFARWSDTLDGFVPPSRDPEDIMVDVGHQLLAALPAAEAALAQFIRHQLSQLAEMPGLSNRERDLFSFAAAGRSDNQLSSLLSQPDALEAVRQEFAAAAARETAAPAPEPITLVEEKIAAGHRLIAELAGTIDPIRRLHLCSLLDQMSRVAEFPEPIRDEFARAARADLPEAGVSGTPSVSAVTLPPRPPRPTGATRFLHDAWVVARQLAFNCLQHEPDDREIAEALVTDRGLILFAELYLHKAKVALTVNGILAYRARLRTEPPAPTAEASDATPAPAPRPARRRRSAAMNTPE